MSKYIIPIFIFAASFSSFQGCLRADLNSDADPFNPDSHIMDFVFLTYSAITPGKCSANVPYSYPSLIYGQNITSPLLNTSNTDLKSPSGAAVDQNNAVYIADTSNHRVLYYSLGQTKASRVYGQLGSFKTNTANSGGISASSLNAPSGAALDSAGNLYVADTGNNRVLYYAAGSTTATRVYGQGGLYTTNTANSGGISAVSLNAPSGVSLDSADNLYVADTGNNRVLYYAAGSTTATRVYGQGGLYTTNAANSGGISRSSLNAPSGAALDSADNLYVADSGNNRVLYYASAITDASRIYGQRGSFTTAGASSKIDGMRSPAGIALSRSDDLFAADRDNNRVLYFCGVL